MALDDRDYMRPPPEKAGGGNPPAPIRRKRRTWLVVVLGLVFAVLVVAGLGVTGNLGRVSDGLAPILHYAKSQAPEVPTPPRGEEAKPLPVTALDAEGFARAKKIILERCVNYRGDVFAREGINENGFDIFYLHQMKHELGPLKCTARSPTEIERLNGLEWEGRVEAEALGASPYRSRVVERSFDGTKALLTDDDFKKPFPSVSHEWSDWRSGGSVWVDLRKIGGQWEVTGVSFIGGLSASHRFEWYCPRPTLDEIKRLLDTK